MGARIAQLRNAFGLDDSEELYGQFSCAHTRPRWGAQFLQVGSVAAARDRFCCLLGQLLHDAENAMQRPIYLRRVLLNC
jgi:hypothetical protein